MNYEFHPEAKQELLEAALRYEFEVPGLGHRFGEEIDRVVQMLLASPALGAHIDNELRHFARVGFRCKTTSRLRSELNHPRQSRGLISVSPSKGLVHEPPKGGLSISPSRS